VREFDALQRARARSGTPKPQNVRRAAWGTAGLNSEPGTPPGRGLRSQGMQRSLPLRSDGQGGEAHQGQALSWGAIRGTDIARIGTRRHGTIVKYARSGKARHVLEDPIQGDRPDLAVQAI